MKKLLFILVSLAVLVGCTPAKSDKQKLKVTVTTSFIGDMVDVLVQDKVDLEVIIPRGEDPHTYEPKPQDYEKLKSADVILYHGLHFEGKMVDVLEEQKGVAVTKNFDPKALIYWDEVVDPHFWFDLELYKQAVEEAANTLIMHLPELEMSIRENLKEYQGKLDELIVYGKEQIGLIAPESRILVSPHDAFSYFSRQFGIEVHAPQGVSTDAEVSTSDLANTAQFIVDHKLKAIFAESTTDPARMRKIQQSVSAKGFEVEVVFGEHKELLSDSLAQEGTFLDMVKHNINLIVTHLR